MIDNKIDDLFKEIENSSEYQSYLSIGEVLKKDENINKMIEEIKELQKKSTKLEYENNMEYKEVDKEIEKKVDALNKIPTYQEYLKRMDEFNDVIATSSHMIEDYVNEKVEK